MHHKRESPKMARGGADSAPRIIRSAARRRVYCAVRVARLASGANLIYMNPAAPTPTAEPVATAVAPAAIPASRRPALLRFFSTGPDVPIQGTKAEIDREFRRKRLAVILSITIGYGLAYTCRLGLAVVKKPVIDAGIFTAD